MATMVGREKDTAKLLNDLIVLDLDAIEAYEAAIARLSTAFDREQLTSFMQDHQRHVHDLSELVRELGAVPETKAGLKQVLTKGKVVIAALIDDANILRAMKSNEDDTNTAYERAAQRSDVPDRILAVFRSNLADERRHREWIENRIAMLKASEARP